MDVRRVIDVNINRLNEGLRVIEDAFRLYYDNKELSQNIKYFRHSITSLMKRYREFKHLFAKRDIINDPGRDIKTEKEIQRNKISDIIDSNCGRVKEALRTLEEFVKLSDKKLPAEIEKKRYEFYELERKMQKAIMRKIHIFRNKRLYPVYSYDHFDGRFKNTINILADNKVAILQLRMKNAETSVFFKAADHARNKLDKSVLIINDRVDIAMAVNADGVHIGKDDIPPEIARKFSNDSMILGYSAICSSDISKNMNKDIDYFGLGAVNRTDTKQTKVIGLKRSFEIRKKYPDVFMVAIGGVNINNAKELIAGGFDMVSVISDLFTEDLEKRLHKYMKMFGKNGVVL